MNTRERFLKTLNFEPVDRLPMIEWAPWWHLTTDRWKQEGLEVELREGLWENESLEVQFGLDLHMQSWIGCFTDRTPRAPFHGGPIVGTMEEYLAIKPTLYPDDPLDHDRMRRIAEAQKRGEVIAWITLDGMFWGPRNLLGIEPHLFAFYDDPELMHAITRDITDYIVDSDGDISLALPWFANAGVEGILPLERQAGVVRCI